MAPKQSGETRTPAVGAMTRWYSRREAALAGASNGEGIVSTVGVYVCVCVKGVSGEILVNSSLQVVPNLCGGAVKLRASAPSYVEAFHSHDVFTWTIPGTMSFEYELGTNRRMSERLLSYGVTVEGVRTEASSLLV